MPSSAMFTTPERSEMIPPSAAKSSGVANVSPDAISADQVKTSVTFAVVWFVIASASGIAIKPRKTAAPPSRRCLRSQQDPTPASAAITPSTIDGTVVRARIGGSGRIQAIAASTTAAIPMRLVVTAGLRLPRWSVRVWARRWRSSSRLRPQCLGGVQGGVIGLERLREVGTGLRSAPAELGRQSQQPYAIRSVETRSTTRPSMISVSCGASSGLSEEV